ncbi:MAG TPA: TonB-dependent receptor [Bryobacteraceae bacterium]|jgi:iron complex outermembrane receptor protein
MLKSQILKLAVLTAVSLDCKMTAQTPSQNLAGASLEDLLNIEVTSVSKKEQALSKTGAAVFVISREDIRRSGATNIPDLLRMAPGVEVAQIESNEWAVSIRGFNTVYANKVLFLVDGRTVYVTGFSGVYWDEINVPLEDIERIEVIRGPGGTVWGANAVDGVINIITRSSADTKGGLVSADAGSRGSGRALVQYGSDAGASGAFRVFGRYANVSHSSFPGGLNSPDGWHVAQAGFRSDWQVSSNDTVSLQGDVQSSRGSEIGQFVPPFPLAPFTVSDPLEDRSGDVLGRWTHTLANGSETSLQIYDTLLHHGEGDVKLANNTLDIEFEHHLAFQSRHDVVWGIDYRFSQNEWTPFASYAMSMIPAHRLDNLFSTFLQDEIQIRKSLFLTIGSKFEHNSYTGFEVEPSAQLVWTPSERNSLWISAARAIRQPNQLDAGVQENLAAVSTPFGPALLKVVGNPEIKAETLNDYEAGYRGQLSPRLSLDVTAFFGFYNRLETAEPQNPYVTAAGGYPLLVIPLLFDDLGHAHSRGLEAFANWNVSSRWKLSPGFSTLGITTALDASSQDVTLQLTPGSSPKYQPQVRSEVNLRRNLDWDCSLKYVSALTALGVPAYTRFDSRLAWRIGESLEISVVGQNLLTPHHIEFTDISNYFLDTQVKRMVFGKVMWRF